jgi:hypothetical protein
MVGEMVVQQGTQNKHTQEQRPILALCYFCSFLMLFTLSIRVYWFPLGKTHMLNQNFAGEPYYKNLNSDYTPAKTGTSIWESSKPAGKVVGSESALPEGEKYMWYSPHSGFSNQARELMNALKIAFLLNRTLILPPVLEHFEVELGSCLRPQHDQDELRRLVWVAISKRFNHTSPRYANPSLRRNQFETLLTHYNTRAFHLSHINQNGGL